LQIGDAITGKKMDGLEIRSSPHAFSADGRYRAALSGRAASVYEVATGRKVSETSFDGVVNTVCFSADAQCYAVGCSDDTVQWVEVETGKKIDSTPFPVPVNVLALSPDGHHLAATSSSHMTAYWREAKVGAKMNSIRGGAAAALTFSADSRYLAVGGRDDPVHVIDIVTGQKVSSAEHGLNLDVSSLSFSPNGRCLLVGGKDKTARLFETTSGKELAKMEFKTDVPWVGFADEHHFAALGQDGTVHHAECAWFDTRDDLAMSWRSGLQLQSGFRFQQDGRLVPLSLEERIAAQDDVMRFVSSSPSPSNRWQHDILKWSRMLPQERSVSPWSSAPVRVVIANKLMQAAVSDTDEITDCATHAPWHPLEPVSLARLDPFSGENSQNTGRGAFRKLFLAKLTLKRLNEANEKVYGRETLADYGVWASKIMHEELHLDPEALEAITFALERIPTEKQQALLDLKAKIESKL
jgi:WD40 repeat protein